MMNQNNTDTYWMIHMKNGRVWTCYRRVESYDNKIPGMLRLFDKEGIMIAIWNLSDISYIEQEIIPDKKEKTDDEAKEQPTHTTKNPLYFKPYTQGCGCMPADVRTPQEHQWEAHNPNPEPVWDFQEEYLEWAMDNDPDFIKEVTDDE